MRKIILVLLLFAPAAVLAQAPSVPLTADDAVAIAIKKNLRLFAAGRDVIAAQAGLRSAQALANPEAIFAPSVLGVGSDAELLIQQPLELNGTRGARGAVASAQLRQTRAQAIVELRNLVFDTRSAYYELARAQELQSLAQDLLKGAQEFHRITHRQVEVGTRPGIEETQTGIEAARAQQQVSLAAGQVRAAEAALNTMLGRPSTEPIGPLAALPSSVETVDEKAAMEHALSARAEITVDEALRDAFQQEARLARAQGLPDLAPQFRAGRVTHGLKDAGIGLGISLPFLDYGSRRNRIQQAQQAARAQEYRIALTRSQIRQEVEQSLARLQSTGAVMKGYQAGILDQAKILLNASHVGFQAGHTSIVAVLEAQRTYRSVLTEYTNALVDHARARAELEKATGAVPARLFPATTQDAATDGREEGAK